MSDLSNFYQGEISKRPLFGGRRFSGEARSVQDEVYLTALKMQGVEELTIFAKHKAVNIDDARRDLAGNDEVRNTILTEIELRGVRKLGQLQDQLYNKFKL